MKAHVFLALFVASASALAQPITVSGASSQGTGYFDGGSAGTYQSNASHTNTVAPGDASGLAYAFTLRGDVTAQLSGTATAFLYQSAAFFTLTTGAAPVQLSNITVSYNGKEVVSGGSTATFSARQFYRADLSTGSFGSDFYYGTYLPARTTPGVYIETLSTGLPTTLLAANTEYRLYMDVYPIIDVSAYPAGSSMLGYALEYGGEVAPWLGGLTVGFNALAVPEPGTALLFAAGVAALLRRRPA